MLEDISCLLGSGEVPSLFTPDEEADIVVRVRDAVRATGKPDTRVSGTVQNRTAFAPTAYAATTTTSHQHANSHVPSTHPKTQQHGEQNLAGGHENQDVYCYLIAAVY